MNMVTIIVALVVLGVIVAIATQPNSFRIERRTRVSAPAEVIHGYVDDFHEWQKWSPYERLDPNLKRTFTGPPAGVGSGYSWEGNGKAGKGSMTILESDLAKRIAIDLQFEKPMKARNLSEFLFERSGQEVDVTWAMSGPNTLIGKVFGLFGGMERLVGPDFEKGLATLKSISEAEAKSGGATGIA